MALSFASKLSNFNNNNQSSYATASWTPVAGKAYILDVVAHDLSGSNPPAPTVTGNGITWTQVAESPVNNTSRQMWRFRGAPSTTGAITIDFGGDSQNACHWHLTEITSANTGGVNGSASIRNTAQDDDTSSAAVAVTLPAFGSASNGVLLAVFNASLEDLVAEAGYTLLANLGSSSSGNILGVASKPTSDTSVTATYGSSVTEWVAIATEIVIGAATDIAPTPESMAFSVVAPSIQIGLSILPTPEVSNYTAVAPTMVRGNLVLTPSPVLVNLDAVAPEFLLIPRPVESFAHNSGAVVNKPPPNLLGREDIEL